MTSQDIAGFIGNSSLLRRLAFIAVHLTTLREWYLRKVLKQTLKKSFAFLDAGSGMGQHAVWIAENYPQSQVLGIDTDSRQIEDCRRFAKRNHIPNLAFESGSLDEVKLDTEFDHVLCASVLEHIENDDKVLKSFHKILKPNGTLIVYVPVSEKRVLKSLERKINKMTEHANAKYPHEHVRYYKQIELLDKLMKNGFKIKTSKQTYGTFGRWSYDIVTTVQYSRFFKLIFPFYFLLVHPFVMFLMWLDMRSENLDGNGLLVVAEKVI